MLADAQHRGDPQGADDGVVIEANELPAKGRRRLPLFSNDNKARVCVCVCVKNTDDWSKIMTPVLNAYNNNPHSPILFYNIDFAVGTAAKTLGGNFDVNDIKVDFHQLQATL